MKMEKTNPCDTCTKFSVCKFSQEYLQIKYVNFLKVAQIS